MGSNVLKAIANIAAFKNYNLDHYKAKYDIRINNLGEQLEYYVKDGFANSFTVKGEDEKLEAHSKVFCYSANQNNPPDGILKGGDAFETKKQESPGRPLALNSSPPKDMLHREDPRILDACRKVDGGTWKEKDLFYIVGYVTKQKIIRYLYFVHGICYAAKPEVYSRLHSKIKSQIGSIMESGSHKMVETVELGRISGVDPLGITQFRMRGMWEIENPETVFDYLYKWSERDPFTLVAVIEAKKYNSYPRGDAEALEKHPSIKVKDCEVRDPNNKAEKLKAKLITFKTTS